MRVLIVTGIFPPDIGGPATYVPTMASELVKRGHEVTVVTLSDGFEHPDRQYSFRVLRIRRRMLKPRRFLLTVATLMRRGRSAQILYVNGLYLEAVVANFFLRKPLIQKIVGDWAWERATNKGWVGDNFDDFQTRAYGWKVELLKASRTFCARRADTVIAPSRYLSRAIAGWGVAESKVTVVHNAVEQPSVTRSSIPLSTRVNIITVGRLVSWKQIDHVIKALKKCDEAGLVIVGDGPERGRLESIVLENQLTDRVYFAGQRSKAETLSLMSACDVFVLNSTYEGFPHVVLEAMSAGLPVVATAVGGTPEVVHDGENGILLPPTANGQLSRALLNLISSSMEREKLAAGAKRTLEQFRHSAMVERTEAMLRNCLHSVPNARSGAPITGRQDRPEQSGITGRL